MKLALAGTALVAVAVLASAAPYSNDPAYAAKDSGPGRIDVSRYPEPQQRNYELFSVKCSKCHPLARPINSRFSSAEWKRYIKRMIRRPNSGINEEQAASVYEFLSYYSAQLGL